jgi:hypothetical protein
MMKELVPAKEMSDEAARAMLDMAEDAAAQVGKEKFHNALVKAMTLAGQFRPTIGTIRRCCGLMPRLDTDAEAVAVAWSFIVGIVRRHVGRDGNGNAILQPWVSYRSPSLGGICVQEDVPDIPIGIHEAVSAMGGWGTLADNLPQWTSQKFNQFKELYQPTNFERDALIASTPSKSLVKKTA